MGRNRVDYKVTEAAELLGVHPDTLRRWDDIGKLKAGRTPGGTRFYRRGDINRILNRKKTKMRTFIEKLIAILLDMGADKVEESFDLHHDGKRYKIYIKVARDET